MRVIIIDDEPAQASWVHQQLAPLLPAQTPVRTYCCAEDFWQDDWLPDLAVLDICLPGQTGIQLAQRLNEAAPGCQIIFLSNFSSYAADVYEARHVWFIPKDSLARRLPQAVAAAMDRLGQIHRQGLVLSQKGKTVVLASWDILYVERHLHTSTLVCRQGTYTDRRRLAELLEALEAMGFARCHESFVVNLNEICQLQRSQLQLYDGTLLPVSRRYSAALRDRFAAFLREGR